MPSLGIAARLSGKCSHVGTRWDTAKTLPWRRRRRAGRPVWGSPIRARDDAPAQRAGLQRGAPGAGNGTDSGAGCEVCPAVDHEGLRGRECRGLLPPRHRATGSWTGRGELLGAGGRGVANAAKERATGVPARPPQGHGEFPTSGSEWTRPWARGCQLTMRSAGGCLATSAILSEALLEASCSVRVERCAYLAVTLGSL